MSMIGITFSAQQVDSSMHQEKPTAEPENEGSSLRTIEPANTSPCLSFRDKVLGDRNVPPPPPKMDFIAEQLMHVELEGENRLLPKISLSKKIRQELGEPWKDALVVKLLGKSVGYLVMKDRLQKIWKLQGGFDILDVDNDFFMVKFDLQSDKLQGGFDYLCVFHWTPEFASPNAKIPRTMV